MEFRIDHVKTLKIGLRHEMLALRKRVFCDALTWDIPHCHGLEADIFDFTSAFYMNWVCSLSGKLLGSVRLMPMVECNLLNTVFKSTVGKEDLANLNKNPLAWEGSRLCLA